MLVIILIITTFFNKSRTLTYYFLMILCYDIVSQVREEFFSFSKPYQGTGFILFVFITAYYLLIPAITFLLSVSMFSKKTFYVPLFLWVTVSFFALSAYPDLRGQSMLNLFYSYYLTLMSAAFIYFISQAKKLFSFTQGSIFLAVCGCLVTTLIAIFEVKLDLNSSTLQHWDLVVWCNCIFYGALILLSWTNRFLKKLSP